MDLPLEIIEGEYAVLQLHPRSWSRLKIQVNTGKVFVTESRLIRRYHVSPEGIQKLMADCRLTSNTISGYMAPPEETNWFLFKIRVCHQPAGDSPTDLCTLFQWMPGHLQRP